MFLKEKFADGVYSLMKGRTVALGNEQDRSQYTHEDTSAPTVSLLALMIIVVIALKLCMCTMAFDVTGGTCMQRSKRRSCKVSATSSQDTVESRAVLSRILSS